MHVIHVFNFTLLRFVRFWRAWLVQVKKQLFGIDNKGMGSEVAVKNELRRTIKVWYGVRYRCAFYLPKKSPQEGSWPLFYVRHFW